MRKYFVLAAFLSAPLGMAQMPSLSQSQQRSTGVVTISSGQTARLNILYPTVPAPILQIQCSANMAIAGEDGGVLAEKSVPQILAGKSVSLEFNADSIPHTGSLKIHAFSIAPNGCHLVTTLEIVDNATLKTVLLVPSEVTYPFTPAVTAQSQRVM